MTVRARGADFSSAQTLEHVVKVAAGLDFAFVKATQGVNYVNPLLHSQTHVLGTAGARVGYYHFLDPGSDGASQWDYFEAAIAGLRRAPVALDFEAKGTTDAQARAFIKRGRQRGYRVGLYGSQATCRKRLGQSWRWVAYWASEPPPIRFDVWQFTNGGGHQDYDVFAGDKAELARWWERHSQPLHRKLLRWWLHDDTTHVAKGPYRLAAAAAAFAAYALRHPGSRTYTLDRK